MEILNSVCETEAAKKNQPAYIYTEISFPAKTGEFTKLSKHQISHTLPCTTTARPAYGQIEGRGVYFLSSS